MASRQLELERLRKVNDQISKQDHIKKSSSNLSEIEKFFFSIWFYFSLVFVCWGYKTVCVYCVRKSWGNKNELGTSVVNQNGLRKGYL